MDLGLHGRVAIVGGSSRGIGYAAALAIAAEGGAVTVVARNPEEVEGAAARISSESGNINVLPICADMAAPDGISEVVSLTHDRWDHVDIVINNIGGPPPGSLLNFTDDDWQRAFDLNFSSARRLNQLVLPAMRDRKFGRIISVLSKTIKEPEEGLGLSTVARSALASYAKLLALEVAVDGVTVNNVLPGSIETARLRSVIEAQAKAANRPVDIQREIRLSSVAAKRFGRPEEVGSLIAFLASQNASYVTGQSIAIEGGQIKSI